MTLATWEEKNPEPEDSEINESPDKAISEHLQQILALKKAEKAS